MAKKNEVEKRRFKKPLGFVLLSLATEYKAFIEKQLQGSSLKWNEINVLATIAIAHEETPFKEFGIRQQTIASISGLDKGTIVHLIDKLEALKLVQRRPNCRDRRVNEIWLTDEGCRTAENFLNDACTWEKTLRLLSCEFRDLEHARVLMEGRSPLKPFKKIVLLTD